MSAISTHVLDTARGTPARAVPVRLEAADGQRLGNAVTDDDGRCPSLGPERVDTGTYRLVFDTEAYFGADSFYPEVVIAFRVADPDAHYHVPLLLSPFAISSYRGS